MQALQGLSNYRACVKHLGTCCLQHVRRAEMSWQCDLLKEEPALKDHCHILRTYVAKVANCKLIELRSPCTIVAQDCAFTMEKASLGRVGSATRHVLTLPKGPTQGNVMSMQHARADLLGPNPLAQV